MKKLEREVSDITRNYTDATERSPMDGWDGGARGFSLFADYYNNKTLLTTTASTAMEIYIIIESLCL
jgi:hypothetical protein